MAQARSRQKLRQIAQLKAEVAEGTKTLNEAQQKKVASEQDAKDLVAKFEAQLAAMQ